MFDPEVPKSERNSEWFEVANLGEQPVDLSGWTITGGDYLTHTISTLVVAPGDLAVLAANGDTAVNGGVEADYVYGTGVPLYNASGRVVLKSATGAVVDRVDWSAATGFPIPKGSSIALAFAYRRQRARRQLVRVGRPLRRRRPRQPRRGQHVRAARGPC